VHILCLQPYPAEAESRVVELDMYRVARPRDRITVEPYGAVVLELDPHGDRDPVATRRDVTRGGELVEHALFPRLVSWHISSVSRAHVDSMVGMRRPTLIRGPPLCGRAGQVLGGKGPTASPVLLRRWRHAGPGSRRTSRRRPAERRRSAWPNTARVKHQPRHNCQASPATGHMPATWLRK
jgi:hypothetical protein